ncbi:glutamyl-tRNA reductase [Flavihumibacter fluvii]|uniref:glutamyl-tRNA reductase n=1 Tax=Flavihumibacter fluvii TaxID=2838157 RepID=UPI001BDF675B|nr:glutamyl-tRNA reductase [Flavihumibacter fluvii]ULQ53826.1 glutamyl-tRNA reductase [Flavihumibacter fluvii]
MLAVAGINYQSAGFEHLSRFTTSNKVVEPCGDGILGKVWVKTCNRIEIYADLNLHCQKASEKLLLQQFGLNNRPEGLYIYFEDDAMMHLLKVSAGLDSAIVGEDQVLHQLKQAYKLSAGSKFNSPLLNKLFHKAFETGKNVRTFTNINKGNVSAASIAVSLIQSFIAEYQIQKNPSVLVIGAGETGALVTQILAGKGIQEISIWNRTASKAKAVAKQYGALAIPVKSLAEKFAQASIVVVAIRKKTPLLDYSQTASGKSAKRIIIDLSLPFQVQEDVASKNSFLYNLEQITAISEENAEKRKEAIDDAMQLVWASLHEIKAWKEQEWVGQTLQQWQILLHQIQERQLKAFAKKNPVADLNALAAYGRQLSANLLRQLAWTIRQQEKEGSEGQQWARLLSTVEPYEQLN